MSTPARARRSAAEPRDAPESPYVGFAEHEDQLTARVVTPPIPLDDWPTWDKGRGPQRFDYRDLAIGLWAVERVGAKGISYGQLDRCFRDCRGVGCHSNKAAAIFATLQAMGLIVKVGNYSTGRRGNMYEVVPETVDLFGTKHVPQQPTPVGSKPMPTVMPPSPPPDDTDPW